MLAANGGRSGRHGEVIVGNGPLFDFGMGPSSINTKLGPIALTYMVTHIYGHTLFDQRDHFECVPTKLREAIQDQTAFLHSV